MIAIRTMNELPKGCYGCVCEYGGWCYAIHTGDGTTFDYQSAQDIRPHNCPLVVVPEKEQDAIIQEASTKINSNDPAVAISSALICTTANGTYFSGFRNGLRYALSILTGEEPKFEDASGGSYDKNRSENTI